MRARAPRKRSCVKHSRKLVTESRIRNPSARTFPLRGASSERFFLYCALVSAARGQGGGLAGEEDIKVFQIAVEDLFDQLAAGTIEDPKLAIAGYWLKYNIDRL